MGMDGDGWELTWTGADEWMGMGGNGRMTG